MIVTKKIDFDKTLKYFLKDKDIYEPFECHLNTYEKFYDRNYSELDLRSRDFSFVTGLMALDKGDLKVCVIHSWVEDRGMVIDTTSLANSKLKYVSEASDEDIGDIKTSLSEKISYIPYVKISNNKLTKICHELYKKSGSIEKIFLDNLTDYLNELVDSVKNDSYFINNVREKYGYDFQPEGFMIEILN